MNKRNISLFVVRSFVGVAIGGVLVNFLGLVLPVGVVKNFFLTSLSLDLGVFVGNVMGVIILDL